MPPITRSALNSITISHSLRGRLAKGERRVPTFPQKSCPVASTVIVFPDDYSSFNFLKPINTFMVLFRRQSLFYVSQFFMRPQPPLFLIRKACFLFLIFIRDGGRRFSSSTKPVFSVSQFFMRSLPPLFLVGTIASIFPCHNATLVRITFPTRYPKWSSASMSKSVYYTASATNNVIQYSDIN